MTREVGPRRYGIGDCLLPLLTGLAVVTVILLGSGWAPSTALALAGWGAGGGALVAWFRIADMGPWHRP